MGPNGTLRDHKGPYETKWDLTGPYGAIGDHRRPYGTKGTILAHLIFAFVNS